MNDYMPSPMVLTSGKVPVWVVQGTTILPSLRRAATAPAAWKKTPPQTVPPTVWPPWTAQSIIERGPTAMLENIRLSFQGIWAHKMRSFLTMLASSLALPPIISIVSTIKGTNEQIKQNLIGAGNNVVRGAALPRRRRLSLQRHQRRHPPRGTPGERKAVQTDPRI